MTLPLLERTGDCTTDVLTVKTVEVVFLVDRLYEVKRWAIAPEIRLGSNVELVSELEKLRVQRGTLLCTLSELNAKINKLS